MYTIVKRFDFAASHQLEGLPETHPCSRLHGHNYQVEIELKAIEPSLIGFVVDYRDLSLFKVVLDEQYDHRHLNDLLPVNPTAENLAKHFYDICQSFEWGHLVSAVRVSETPKTSAEYRP